MQQLRNEKSRIPRENVFTNMNCWT